MKIVAIADTHNQQQWLELPQGDVLVVAGDMTLEGRDYEVEAFGKWILEQPFKHKVVIAGNHDFLFQRKPKIARLMVQRDDNIHYLQDSEVTIEGVKFYGTPWQPWFYDWAFNVPRGQLKPYWDKIPNDTDVLITHGPPMGILDQAKPYGDNLGCGELIEAVLRVKPKVNIFGHIHGGYGYKSFNGTEFFNASVVDESYRLANKPWEIEL